MRALALALLVACGDSAVTPPTHVVRLERVARTADLAGCAFASPVVAGELVVVATGQGIVTAYTQDGAVRWETQLAPVTAGDRAWIAATPVVVAGQLVVVWQDTGAGDERHAHHAAVLDAATGAIDARYPTLTFAAQKPAFGGGTVTFSNATAFSRSKLVASGTTVYVSFGNIQDIQPWHGWVFELDLERWRTGGAAAAITASLVTTPEADCGPPGESGADDMICGGGVWAPSGPTLVETGGAYELWIPTGNGQLDLGRGDFANTIMRTGPGLAFDPGCDARCDAFDPIDPDRGCLDSCANAFMPRLREGDPPLAPPPGFCEGKTFLECYARLDLDLGADSPALVEAFGRRLAVLPAKDGAVYLFDAAHFGTMFDRLVVRDFCGTGGATCTANWAGTMVTQPLIVDVDGAPLAVIPTFYFDDENPAGVLGIELVDGPAGPTLRERWSAPPRDDPEAVARFREHTGRAAQVEVGGLPYVVIGDPGAPRSKSGILYAIDPRTGLIADRGALDGPGHKYIEPAVIGTRVFVTSCEEVMTGPTHLEIWDVR